MIQAGLGRPLGVLIVWDLLLRDSMWVATAVSPKHQLLDPQTLTQKTGKPTCRTSNPTITFTWTLRNLSFYKAPYYDFLI